MTTVLAALLIAVAAHAQSSRQQFEVASIRQCADASAVGRGGAGMPQASAGRLTLTCNSPSELIRQAYVLFAGGRVQPMIDVPVEGGPAWIDSLRYTISAKAEGNPGMAEMMGPMLQNLLEDRFQVKIHRETREAQAYELTVSKGGLKAQRVAEGSCTPINLDRDLAPQPPGEPRRKLCGSGGISIKRPNATLNLEANSLDDFSKALVRTLGRPVINKTGINGLFDFHMTFSPDEATPGIRIPRDADVTTSATAPSFFTAIQEQLGLKLESARGPVEVLVIDSVSKPTEN